MKLPSDFGNEIAKALGLSMKAVEELFEFEEDKEGFFYAKLKEKKFLEKPEFKKMCTLVRELGGDSYLEGMKAWKVPGPYAKKGIEKPLGQGMDSEGSYKEPRNVIPTEPSNTRAPKMETITISEVVIGERFRKNIGSISSLVASIKEVGLLHPIVVSEKNELVAGVRRIKAYEILGLTEISCTRVNIADLRKGEIHENMIRKDFIESEILAIDAAMTPEVSEAAKERQGTRTDLGKQLPAKLAESRDIIASYVGVSHGTLDKLRAIGKAVEKEPEKFGPLLQKVDNKETSVAHAYSIIKTAEKHVEPQPLPTGVFDVILADPPWEYYLQKRGSTLGHYEAQPIEDICKLKVPSADNAVLFLWATNPKLEDALEVMKAWGFQYKTNLVWVKDKIGTGYYFRGQHELLFLGTKGNMGVPEEQNRPSSVLNAPRTEHSEKPTEVYALIEAMYPVGKYLELYARQKRGGWEPWGNEIKEN